MPMVWDVTVYTITSIVIFAERICYSFLGFLFFTSRFWVIGLINN